MIEISLLQCLKVMGSNMRVTFDLFQGKAEGFTTLAESLPDAGKDALRFRLF